ncbi:MAG: hypothetical protein PHY48_01705 [Candidatus Cloacimonetes bacterium]|nr:hypothetical protein [Candidatus Cloacimonadota bacterium]
MLYTLPDGRIIDLTCVSVVTPVKDFGLDPKTIVKSRIGFSIILKKREVLDVVDYYHYSDWATAKNKLNKLREEIVSRWSQIGKVC